MPNFRLLLEYDGTDFEGWQTQAARSASAGAAGARSEPEASEVHQAAPASATHPCASAGAAGARSEPEASEIHKAALDSATHLSPRTIQSTLEAAITRITGQQVPVTGSGRTDAGVHALGQVANLHADTRLGPDELRRALNAVLPRDVAVRSVEQVSDAFHARRDARSKLYVYRLWTGPVRSPLRERTSHRVAPPLDLAAMRHGARLLVGTHDFTSFQAAGSAPRTRVRTLTALEILGDLGGEVCIEVEGNGFLRHMVRTLVGTLVEVGRGKRAPESLPALIEARDRTLAGPTAPARGLTLVRVDY